MDCLQPEDKMQAADGELRVCFFVVIERLVIKLNTDSFLFALPLTAHASNFTTNNGLDMCPVMNVWTCPLVL